MLGPPPATSRSSQASYPRTPAMRWVIAIFFRGASNFPVHDEKCLREEAGWLKQGSWIGNVASFAVAGFDTRGVGFKEVKPIPAEQCTQDDCEAESPRPKHPKERLGPTLPDEIRILHAPGPLGKVLRNDWVMNPVSRMEIPKSRSRPSNSRDDLRPANSTSNLLPNSAEALPA